MNFGSSWNFVNGIYFNTPISNEKSIIEINTDSPNKGWKPANYWMHKK